MIRPEMIAWQETTKQLLVLTEQNKESERDEVIEKIEALLEKREELQTKISEPFTEEEKVFGTQLAQQEQQVLQQLASYTKQIRADIAQSQSKKTHMTNYINPYSRVARDGTFYDTKK